MSRLLDQIRTFEQIFAALQSALPDSPLEVRSFPDDDTCVSLPTACLLPAVQVLLEQFDFYHLSAITGLDTGVELELLYHFWNRYGVTLRVALPYDQATMPTLMALIPGAALYERELHDMLGVSFIGHATEILFLPDDWEGPPPGRKGEGVRESGGDQEVER